MVAVKYLAEWKFEWLWPRNCSLRTLLFFTIQQVCGRSWGQSAAIASAHRCWEYRPMCCSRFTSCINSLLEKHKKKKGKLLVILLTQKMANTALWRSRVIYEQANDKKTHFTCISSIICRTSWCEENCFTNIRKHHFHDCQRLTLGAIFLTVCFLKKKKKRDSVSYHQIRSLKVSCIMRSGSVCYFTLLFIFA